MHMLSNGYAILSGLVRGHLFVDTLYRILSFHNSLIFLSFWKYRGNIANLKLKYKWQNFVSYVTGIRIKPLSGWDLVRATLPALACTQLIHIWISQSRQKILSNTYLCMCHHKSVYECIPIYVYTHIKAWRASIIWEGMGKHGRIGEREGRQEMMWIQYL